MHRDTCHAIRIAIQFASIAILNFFCSLDTITVFCPGFQKGRVPSEKGTLAR